MTSIISYPRTDGEQRFERDILQLERWLNSLIEPITAQTVGSLLELVKRIGWNHLPPHLKARLLHLLRQTMYRFNDKNCYVDTQSFTSAQKDIHALGNTVDKFEAEFYSLVEKQGLIPFSLQGVSYRLEAMKGSINAQGYIPKYSDSELKSMVESGSVSNERYQLRFMESEYLRNSKTGEAGMLGKEMVGQTGEGAKYWTTTFDQIEDADTDPKLIANKLGLELKEETNYALIAVDLEKAAALTHVETISTTFKNISDFAVREFPQLFTNELMALTMNSDFQARYALFVGDAMQQGILRWSSDEESFRSYLSFNKVDPETTSLMLIRMRMHAALGNNEHFTGDGLTKNLIEGSENQSGAVELLNFERRTVDLDEYKAFGAIKIIKENMQ